MHRPVFSEMTQVRFVVITPDAPSDQPDEIFCSLSTDGWPAQGRTLKKIGPHIYTASGPMRAGMWVEYKFLREPNWETVEKGEQNLEIANRRLFIKSDVVEQVIMHRVQRWADRPRLTNTSIEFNQPGEGSPLNQVCTITGDVRLHHLFHSPQLQNARTIMVYLPPGYDDAPDERYPVLYMHDGNNLFDVRTSATGVEWGVDETAERLVVQGRIKKTIIVGICNTPQRTKEYAPFKDDNYGGGFGRAYLEFIAETLKPFIDHTYRTLPEREHTGLAGSSLGGLISLYGLFHFRETFGMAAAVSPALWWAKRAIFADLVGAPTPRPIRLWIDMGTDEGDAVGPLVEYKKGPLDCKRLTGLLLEKGYEPEEDFHYEEIEGGRHHEFDWAARIDRVLTYLIGIEDSISREPEPVGGLRRADRK